MMFTNEKYLEEAKEFAAKVSEKIKMLGPLGQKDEILAEVYNLIEEKNDKFNSLWNLWNPIDEVVRNLPDIKVGDSVSEKAKELILQHPALLEAFQTNHFALKTIVNNHGENIHPTIKNKAEVLLKMNEISLKKIRKVEVLDKPEDKRYFIVFFTGTVTEKNVRATGSASIVTENNEFINADKIYKILSENKEMKEFSITGFNEINEFDFHNWNEDKK